VQKPAFTLRLKFLAHIPHIHLHNIAAAGPLVLPDLLQQLITAQNAALMLQQGEQQHELPRGEVEGSACTPNLPR
jgi:lipid A disaccharide synthetase